MDLITKESIVLQENSSSIEEVFQQIALLAIKNQIINENDHDKLIAALNNREKMTSTNIGEGIAIPHAQSDIIKRPLVIFLRLKKSFTWPNSLDQKKTKLIFSLLIPESLKGSLHIELLSSISQKLLMPQVRHVLLNSTSKQNIIDILDANDQNNTSQDKLVKQPHEPKINIVALTACPVGVAHTFLGANKLQQGGQELGYNIKVETHGANGVKNDLTSDEIQRADVVIIASDITLDLSRFNNKKIYQTKITRVIKDPVGEIKKSLTMGQVIVSNHVKSQQVNEKKRLSLMSSIMSGVSHMIPFVILGGIFIAIAIGAAKGLHGQDANPKDWIFLREMTVIGEFAFTLMIPILGGYIAYAIAGRAALVPAMVASIVGNNGSIFHRFIDLDFKIGDQAIQIVPMGFVGAIIAGLIVGYVVKWINSWQVPQSIAPTIPLFFIPLIVGGGLSLIFIFLVGAPIGYVMTYFQVGISWIYSNPTLGKGVAFAMGLLIGAMAGFDMGGPINKVAFLTTSALVTMKIYQPMGTIAAAIPVAPLGMGLSTIIFRKFFDEESKQAGIAALVMGTIGISEGAIPFALKDPKRAIIANVIGSSLAGGFAGLMGIENYAQHGGLIMAFLGAIPFGIQTLMFIIIVGSGALITSLTYGLMLTFSKTNVHVKTPIIIPTNASSHPQSKTKLEKSIIKGPND